MKRTASSLLVALLFWSAASAGTLKRGDREFAAELGFSNLDLGSLGPFDLESASGPRGAISLTWVQSRFVQVGFRGTLTSFESDLDESIEGAALGGILHFKVPIRGSVDPFVGVGISVPYGNLGARFKHAFDLSAGLRVYPSKRFGFSVSFEYQSYQGESFVPDADGTSLTGGFLYRF